MLAKLFKVFIELLTKEAEVLTPERDLTFCSQIIVNMIATMEETIRLQEMSSPPSLLNNVQKRELLLIMSDRHHYHTITNIKVQFLGCSNSIDICQR
jgi:hypothetical protein